MAPTFSQSGRLMALTTPLGADALLLEKMSGFEAVSELFRFELDRVALATQPVAFDKVLGQPATVTMQLASGARYFNGIVSRVAQGAQVPGVVGGVTFTRYRLELVPKLWLLTRRSQSRH